MKNRPPKQDREFLLVDGNYSFYPEAYCAWHQAWLTDGLLETHRCRHRKCDKLQEGVDLYGNK